MNEFDQDELYRLARISKINIFIKNFISERAQSRQIESFGSNF
jgi:hypothetical protein